MLPNLIIFSGVHQVLGEQRAQLGQAEEAGAQSPEASSSNEFSDLPGLSQALKGPELQKLWRIPLQRSGHGN